MANRNALPKSEPSLQSRLGLAVKNYRKKLDITQEELAWRADMHRSYIADIERGGRNITLRNLVGLATALEIPVQSLFSQLKGPELLGEVLLAEDSETDAELTLKAFARAKVSNPVSVVGDGEEVWEYLKGVGRHANRKNFPLPQLVLLDLTLPKLSGVELLRRMKADERTRAIPVVILSGSRNDRDIIECARLGAENYIIKPVSFVGLCEVTSQLNLSWVLVGEEPRIRSGGMEWRSERKGATLPVRKKKRLRPG